LACSWTLWSSIINNCIDKSGGITILWLHVWMLLHSTVVEVFSLRLLVHETILNLLKWYWRSGPMNSSLHHFFHYFFFLMKRVLTRLWPMSLYLQAMSLPVNYTHTHRDREYTVLLYDWLDWASDLDWHLWCSCSILL
jgi:hypothetical protein